MESQNEYDFVKQGQRSFRTGDSYWLSGTTNTTLEETVAFSDYLYDNSGKFDRLCLFSNALLTGGKIEKITYLLW